MVEAVLAKVEGRFHSIPTDQLLPFEGKYIRCCLELKIAFRVLQGDRCLGVLACQSIDGHSFQPEPSFEVDPASDIRDLHDLVIGFELRVGAFHSGISDHQLVIELANDLSVAKQ